MGAFPFGAELRTIGVIIVLGAHNAFAVAELKRRVAASASPIRIAPSHTQRINSEARPRGTKIGTKSTLVAFAILPLSTVGIADTVLRLAPVAYHLVPVVTAIALP